MVEEIIKFREYPTREELSKLARTAGRIIRERFGEPEDSETRRWVDAEVFQIILHWFQEHYPKIALISEDGGWPVSDAKFTAYVDAVDGGIPFKMRMPISTCCITVVEGCRPLVAVIYDPFQDRLWSAEVEKGAFLNNRAIIVPEKLTLLNQATIIDVTVWPTMRYPLDLVANDLRGRKGVLVGNILSLGFVGGSIASGLFHASISPNLRAWEAAAISLIIREAGARVTDLFGRPLDLSNEGRIAGHIIANKRLHDELLEVVHRHVGKERY